MNKFFVTGLPRSGTTVFLKTLSNLDNVQLYTTNEYHEPFSWNQQTFALDVESRLKEAEGKCTAEYFGFKVFQFDHINFATLLKNDYKPFAVIRKDIWKAVFSKVVASAHLNRRGLDYHNISSTDVALPDEFTKLEDVYPNVRQSFRKQMYDKMKFAYELETKWKDIDIVYFEDLVKPNSTFDCINNYFGREVVFNLNYNDNQDVEKYLPGYEKDIWRQMSIELNKKILVPDNAPQYIKDCLTKYL